jgi:hypothetical protein
LNSVGSPIVATKALATSGPTPGTPSNAGLAGATLNEAVTIEDILFHDHKLRYQHIEAYHLVFTVGTIGRSMKLGALLPRETFQIGLPFAGTRS